MSKDDLVFDKIMAYAVFLGGLISNSIGLINNLSHLVTYNRGQIELVITALSLLVILIAKPIFFRKEAYSKYTFVIVCMTAFVIFPSLFWKSTDNAFVAYLFIIPAALGLLTVKSPKLFLVGLLPLPIYIIEYVIKLNYNIHVSENPIIHTLLTKMFFGTLASYIFIWFITSYSSTRIYKAIREIESINYHDEITGLYNRRKLLEDLENTKFKSALMIDIDFMKSVNDVYGSKAADEVLKRVAVMVSELMSGVYRIYRYSGDKFLILSRLENEDSLKNAKAIFDNIRENLQFDGMKITASGGFACDERNDVLIEVAERNLLNAKGQGKNQLHSGLKKIY